MKLLARRYLLFSIFILQFYALQASSVSIQIDNPREYEILAHFFKMGLLEEEYGYVLEGSKPISIANFYSLDNFPIARDLEYTEKQFMKTLLVREAIPIWNKLCSVQKKFVLKVTPLNDPGKPELGWEISFINVPKLKETIEKNIDLFRYILGPLIQSNQILERLAYSKEAFSDVLCNDCVLTGIVLGFGSHNSVVGGRSETINALSRSRDIAPFAAKSHAMRDLKEYYGWYFFDIAGGETFSDSFKKNDLPLKLSYGFADTKDELLAIEATNEPLPPCLTEKPRFVFGAYTGSRSNKSLFTELKQSQKKIQKLLKKPDFLEQILWKISEKKPRITCKKPSLSKLQLSFFRESLTPETWNYILDKAVNDFERPEQKFAFINSLSNPSAFPSETMLMARVFESTLKGLKKACQNLANANTFFETLSKDPLLQSIVPNQLYFKKVLEGSGKEIKGPSRIRASYIITDAKDNIFFAHHDTWISLAETIPGFAHGLQGMCIGEKREIFIHPCLAYGELTTLPPCTQLIVKVQLLDIEKCSHEKLPSLEPLDFSWIQNPKLHSLVEKSIELKPSFIGSFYTNLLDKIEGCRKTAIIAGLDMKVLELKESDSDMR